MEPESDSADLRAALLGCIPRPGEAPKRDIAFRTVLQSLQSVQWTLALVLRSLLHVTCMHACKAPRLLHVSPQAQLTVSI